MTKYKVLYITHYSLLYGANKSLLNLLSGLKDKIDPIVIVPKNGTIVNELEKMGVKYFVIPFYALPNPADRSLLRKCYDILKVVVNLIAIIQISYIVKKRKIEIIHSNSILVRIGYLIAKITTTKHVWHVRETPEAANYNLKSTISNQVKLLQKSDQVVFISDFIKNYYYKHLQSNGIVVYNGVVKYKQISNNENKEPYFLYCGAINEQKRVEDVILGFSNVSNIYPEFTLYIIGTGSEQYMIYLNNLISSLGITDKVIFKGFLDNPLNMMKKSFALIVPSRAEPMGRVTVEAMSQGCPVIGYRGGATQELITNKITGLLYNTIDEMSDEMIQIIENIHMRNKIISNALKEVVMKYTEEIYSNKVFDIYIKIIR
jgi:glycosyltransferase involved in cell wall biosynthesis